MSELGLQLQSYRLTTAEIIYHLPDHPSLLQTYVWQGMDKAPDYPKLRQFLSFWQANLDGKLHSVTVGSKEVIGAPSIRAVAKEFTLH